MISNEFHWFSMIFIDFLWMLMIPIDFQWISMIFIVFQWFSLNFNWFSLILIEFHGFHGFHGFRRMPWNPYEKFSLARNPGATGWNQKTGGFRINHGFLNKFLYQNLIFGESWGGSIRVIFRDKKFSWARNSWNHWISKKNSGSKVTSSWNGIWNGSGTNILTSLWSGSFPGPKKLINPERKFQWVSINFNDFQWFSLIFIES